MKEGLRRGGPTLAGGSPRMPVMAERVAVCNSRKLVRQYCQGVHNKNASLTECVLDSSLQQQAVSSTRKGIIVLSRVYKETCCRVSVTRTYTHTCVCQWCVYKLVSVDTPFVPPPPYRSCRGVGSSDSVGTKGLVLSALRSLVAQRAQQPKRLATLVSRPYAIIAYESRQQLCAKLVLSHVK